MLVAGLLTAALTACGEASSPAVSAQPAPEGTRWVGYRDVVVAVPDWWTTGETECMATPVETTVYFDLGGTVDCETPTSEAVREVSALAVLDGRKGYGELLLRDAVAVGEADGRDVVERDGCEEYFDRVCRRVFGVPSEGVVFAVTIHDAADGDYAAIRDSVRVLPDGQTTVPLATAGGWTPSWGAEPRAVDSLVQAIEGAGLQTEVVTPEPAPGGDVADLPEGSLLDVDPALGSVVDDGAAVTITVMGPRPGR